MEERRRINRAGTAAEGRGRPVPSTIWGMTVRVEGLGWHDPDHASRGAPVVGAPIRSYSYGVVAPPRIWGRGIPNAAHGTPSTAF